jgi:hypothetical protein
MLGRLVDDNMDLQKNIDDEKEKNRALENKIKILEAMDKCE